LLCGRFKGIKLTLSNTLLVSKVDGSKLETSLDFKNEESSVLLLS